MEWLREGCDPPSRVSPPPRGADVYDYVDVDRPTFLGDHIMFEFLCYNAANPDIYAALIELARRVKNAGHKRCSARVLWETIRFRRMVSRKPGQKWVLNNTYLPYYVRLIEQNEPELRDFFEKRKSRADQLDEI